MLIRSDTLTGLALGPVSGRTGPIDRSGPSLITLSGNGVASKIVVLYGLVFYQINMVLWLKRCWMGILFIEMLQFGGKI